MNDLQRINDLERMNDLHLRIESDAFKELRHNINSILLRTLKNMCEKDSDTAEIKMSLKIEFEKAAYVHNSEDVILPRFTHKVTSQMTYKSEENGYVGGKDYELVFDKTLQEYVMRPLDEEEKSLLDI